MPALRKPYIMTHKINNSRQTVQIFNSLILTFILGNILNR